MKARFLFWTSVQAREVPVRDVLYFNKYVEDVVDEQREMLKSAVAEGVAEVLDEVLN